MSIAEVTAIKYLMTYLIGNGSIIWYNLYEAGNSAIALKTINAYIHFDPAILSEKLIPSINFQIKCHYRIICSSIAKNQK